MKVEPGTVLQQIQAARGAVELMPTSTLLRLSGAPGDMPIQPLHLDEDHVTPGGACESGVISSHTANRTPGSE